MVLVLRSLPQQPLEPMRAATLGLLFDLVEFLE